MCIRHFSYEDIFRSEKALLNLETMKEYEGLYINEVGKSERHGLKNTLNTFYHKTSCNGILDLYNAVWFPNNHYRKKRIYDKSHFLGDNISSPVGYFVAIQSWLDVDSWLPERFNSIDEFYDVCKHGCYIESCSYPVLHLNKRRFQQKT
jgi:hypothetical protein